MNAELAQLHLLSEPARQFVSSAVLDRGARSCVLARSLVMSRYHFVKRNKIVAFPLRSSGPRLPYTDLKYLCHLFYS